MNLSLERFPPWTISLFIHVSIVLIFIFLKSWNPQFQRIDFEVLDYTQNQPKTLNLQPQAIPKEKKTENTPRQIFGVTKKSITAAPDESSAEIKQGNTVAKTPDDLKMLPTDAESLPIPADDYLVSKMPVLESEFRIPYPEEARKKAIEGPVVMDLLIDQNGRVRQVTLINGPGHGLNEAAVQAVENFKFHPANIDKQAVAVRIRYTYRFVLENR